MFTWFVSLFLYENWNSLVGELMKYTIVYWSRYGHGKKLVGYLAEKLKEKGGETQIFTTDEADPKAMPEADVYVFSAPTEAFNIQRNMKTFMKNLEGMDEKKYGIINTHGMNRNWLHKMEKLLSKKKMVKIADVDFQIGKDAQSGNAFMEDYKPKIEAFAAQL